MRQRGLVDIYRHSSLFVDLRDPTMLKGTCSICEYRSICGGSRARAYALTADPLESDALCTYQPAGAALLVSR